GVGNASSIGITGDENEIEKYEDYLRKNIFAERPFSHLKVVFDKEAEQFLVEYSDSEHQKWYDNQRIDTGTDKKISLWTKIIDDIYKNIENTRLPQYEGIMHYLNWAREEMKNEKRFEAELEKKLLKADESIKLIDKTPKSYRLIYGDKKAGQYNLDANLKSLKEKMSNEVGEPVSDPTDSNKNIDFGDRNSLIFFAYSNEIMPESIEVLKNMKTEYTRQITSRGAVAWRSFVYHNYKCDWKMWEIERMLPEFKSKGLKTLTHGSFYWVLENDELVKLFVHCTALGIIREEKSLDNSKYWVCGPPSKTFEDNDEEVYLLTPENETSDMFTALVAFAVTQRQVDNIDKIDFDQVKRMLKDQLKVQKQKRKTFNQLKDGYADKNEWVKEYNKQVEVDKYEKQMWLFLSRIFWYYLKEEHKNENK
ncbi:MAG: hypothetical protein GY757_52140, partial [bacterium]|nr:hypothetical protein [bacterium]